MKLIIHDLSKEDFNNISENLNEEDIIICKGKRINKCIRCFGFWIKTPGECVIKDDYNKMGEKIASCDELIIISECKYGMYSPFIKNILDRSIVYVIANCGFYEGKQNKIALNIMKCWCKKMNIKWAQGIGIGAGEMMGGLRNVPMGKGHNTNLGLALDNLAKNINENKSEDDIFTTPSMFPRFAFRLVANRFWISKANRNGLKKRDLNKCIVKQ
ncbi:hypothetical protein [uncultured Clostridium sp.]|uniref:hypothetical protein n=1 Tax=uncultured Clostridium sp. TaxID=59620 RepID=UPI000821122B|nr:hypothetical protein [uncultured Clostridium sp.]SCJ05924.1 Uncharacterised protein [uncultured Clostridium sp.]